MNDSSALEAPMRLAPVDEGDVDPRVQLVLERARARYGWLPNTIRVMARGRVAADLYLEAGQLNERGAIAESERELLAVLTAARNGCDYCRLAHSLAAGALGVPEAEIAAASAARSFDPRTEALLRFASRLLELAGRLPDEDIEEARRAGLDDATLLDVVTIVMENTLGNVINNLARTPLDRVLARAGRRAVHPQVRSV